MELEIFKEFNALIQKQLVYKIQKDKIIIHSASKFNSSSKYLQSFKENIVSHSLIQILLPSGWPHSVSDDYVQYQIWDSAQAFCSSVINILTTRAILTNIGFGDIISQPLSSTFAWFLKDGTTICGRLLFVGFKGKKFDIDCKKWRFFADSLSNMAISLELIIPNVIPFSKETLSLLAATKAIVEVAGSATRASITHHQALRDNVADLTAKETSKEMFINLCASIISVVCFIFFENGAYDWILFTIFMILHFFTNYKAIKALNFKTLNEERYVLLLSHYLVADIPDEPWHINKKESIFLGMRYTARNICNFNIKMGGSLKSICHQIDFDDIECAVRLFEDDDYILLLQPKRKDINVLLKRAETPNTVILAYFHSVLYGLALSFYNQLTWQKSLFEFYRVDTCIQRLQKLNFKRSIPTNKGIIEDLPFDKKQILKEFVPEEFNWFKQKSLEVGWQFDSHQLNLGEWRYQL